MEQNRAYSDCTAVFQCYFQFFKTKTSWNNQEPRLQRHDCMFGLFFPTLAVQYGYLSGLLCAQQIFQQLPETSAMCNTNLKLWIMFYGLIQYGSCLKSQPWRKSLREGTQLQSYHTLSSITLSHLQIYVTRRCGLEKR